MYEFDQDTLLQPLGAGVYGGQLSDRWSIGHVPNGGYLLAFVMSALKQALPGSDPVSITAHYLRPGIPGDARVEVEVIKSGRRFSTATARLLQGDKEALRVLATYGNLGSDHPLRHADGMPPQLPKRTQVRARQSTEDSMSIRDRFDIELDPATTHFMKGLRATQAEIRGWLRLADGRKPDVHAMGLIADAFPPAVFQIADAGWVPTLELTVHIRSRPTSEWLACVFRTRFLQNGLLEEDGEMWDESGALVAMSRQLALPPQAPR